MRKRMRVRKQVPLGVVMPGTGAFLASAVINSEVSNN
jgi:hypothetical protein